MSLIENNLPPGVNILTLEPWSTNSYILRLEHFLEKDDDSNLSQLKTVDLQVGLIAITFFFDFQPFSTVIRT